MLPIESPGGGETQIAIAPDHRAVGARYRVYHTTAADLAAHCHLATIEGDSYRMRAHRERAAQLRRGQASIAAR